MSNSNNSKVVHFNIKEKEKEESKIIIKSICKRCINLLDATDYYCWTKKDKNDGLYFFCNKNIVNHDKIKYRIDLVTWSEVKDITYWFSDIDSILDFDTLLKWEPAEKYKKCWNLREEWVECEDYEEKKSI